MLKSNSGETALLVALQREGFCFVKARSMQRLLEHCGALPDWSEFAASWNDLGA